MVNFIKNLRPLLNPKTLEAYYVNTNYVGFIKHIFGACGMQPAALVERRIGIMKQVVLVACILFKYLHKTQPHFTWPSKWRCAVGSVAHASRSICYAHIFIKLVFGSLSKLCNKLVLGNGIEQKLQILTKQLTGLNFN